ncbi:MAG: Fe-S cluster assembly protein SufD [Bacteroidales bacterium]|nr:Fe-S cluster assembly protein SufD [Bacteroidales bacterium]
MQQENKESITAERFINLYEKNRKFLAANDTPGLKKIREDAMASFMNLGFPDTSIESWRLTDLDETFSRAYDYHLSPENGIDFQKVFQCNIPHLETAVIGQLNGWYVSKDVPLMELGNGIIMGSLAEARKQYPQLIEKYFGTMANDATDGFTALNTAFAQDGVFIYVPDKVKSPKPVQLINVIHHDDNLFLQSRNLIVLGANAGLSLVHCNDSYNHQASFSNIVTEIHIGEHGMLEHYKLQNLNNNSTLISSVFFRLEASANLESHYISLNGGLLRNNIGVLLNGRHANANLNGLYLMDRKQHIDNHVFVDHAFPDCTSNENFKGILDEHAHAIFNGHVLVRRDATKTDARQSNKNILLTDTARVNSKPFLEIYNDDVKCSHGSTTGQLDQDSMFYLRQRGIGEETARMLLMFAFADELVMKIAIPQLRQRLEDMVKKRLQGELQICEQCVLHCSTPDHPVEFPIDMSKL